MLIHLWVSSIPVYSTLKCKLLCQSSRRVFLRFTWEENRNTTPNINLHRKVGVMCSYSRPPPSPDKRVEELLPLADRVDRWRFSFSPTIWAVTFSSVSKWLAEYFLTRKGASICDIRIFVPPFRQNYLKFVHKFRYYLTILLASEQTSHMKSPLSHFSRSHENWSRDVPKLKSIKRSNYLPLHSNGHLSRLARMRSDCYVDTKNAFSILICVKCEKRVLLAESWLPDGYSQIFLL